MLSFIKTIKYIKTKEICELTGEIDTLDRKLIYLKKRIFFMTP
jgi:ERCC4-related helicase